MSRRIRRIVMASLALGLMVLAAAAMQRGDGTTQAFHVVCGLRDQQPTDWSGQVEVTGGEVAALAGWRFEGKDTIDGATGWKCRTQEYIVPGQRFPWNPPPGKTAKPPDRKPWPKGIDLAVRGATPGVTLKFAQGMVKFTPSDIALGEPKTFLDGQVRVERVPAVALLRGSPAEKQIQPVQDDYPAFWVRYKTGKQYLAWLAYQGEKDSVLLTERDGPEGKWSEARAVAGPGDHFRVALATTHDNTLWIVWSEQRQKRWNLFGRPYKDGKLGEEVWLTDSPGPNLWHRMTTDRRGRVWLAWQGFRDGQSDIFARCFDDAGWHEPMQVSTGKANDWDPAIAADYKEDRVWVGWDTYETGNYGVRVRSISGGPKPVLGDVLTPEASPRFGAHISLACDRQGRLWTAWDEAATQWGKDDGYLYQGSRGTGLYRSRAVRVKCLVDGNWLEPSPAFASILTAEFSEFNELPQLQDDGKGTIWLAFRSRACVFPRVDGWASRGGWNVFATAYLGDRWLAPILLEHSAGRNDMRTSSQRDPEGNVYFAYAADNRTWQRLSLPSNHTIAVSRLTGAPKPGETKLADSIPRPNLRETWLVHPREKEQVARIRGYKIEQSGKSYRIYRGDLHRHTDISSDGMGDGSLMDLHRYALDAAALDFILVADHNMGQDNEYSWWRTQKANDLYTVPGGFISMYGYERSVQYPNGHRNVIWPERGHRTLPLPKPVPGALAADTGRLYANLRQTGGICTLHTSATGQGTNWEEKIDGNLEPVVEIFQGFHASFEAPGAPRIVDVTSDVVHTSYKPDGYVSRALAKGYRLGFQASSDHTSTHVSFTCILAEEFTRTGLIEALRKRHCYAATDNIVLDVRAGALGLMGDEVRTAKPRLDVVVLGTALIDRIDVVRDGEVVHTERPGKEEARFGWEDPKPVKGEQASVYYVRVLQKDGQMAWASPIWVRP